MARRTVNITLSASGGNQVAAEFGKAGKASTDLIVNIKKIGNVFGEVGGHLGGFVQNLLKGGIWGIAQAAIGGVVSLCQKWRDSAKEAAEAAEKAAQRARDAHQSYIDNYMAAVKKAASTEDQWLSHGLSLTKQRIDATNNLVKATLELEKAEARARGDKSAMERIDRQIADADVESQREMLRQELKTAELRRQNAEKSKTAAQRGVNLQLKMIEKADDDSRKGLKKALADVGVFGDEYEKRREYFASDAYEKIRSDRKSAREKKASYEDDVRRYTQESDKAMSDILAIKQRMEALDKASEARRINAEQDLIDKEKEEEKKAEAEKERDLKKIAELQRKIAEERKRIEQEAAKERERLEKEAHQKRMADIRAEIAEQGRAASTLRGRAVVAQSEFDKAFAMFRDPSRAAAEIGEEKSYASDLDRLHKTARQYGGKWRIDELSRLMAAGDTQGVTDTLNTWRKSKGFTPQVEAMVRASAAENAKTTVEDELRKIDATVATMNDVLKQMADAQSGKLGTIADSTSGLAAKVDQLLRVKG